jgi:pilus assembly protein CpaB
MNMRSLIIGIGALFIAAIAAVFARNMFASSAVQQTQAMPVKQEIKLKVLVAVKPLPLGTILKAEDVKYAEWPEDAIDVTFYRDSASKPEDMVGNVVKSAVLAGQPIQNTAIVGPGERGFLAAVLKPGMRAVSVSVTPTSGVAGFIFPGDHVDVLLTHEVQNADKGQLRGSETILENVRIIAVDQNTNDQDKIAGIRSTVTFEVQPKFVELLNVAQRMGGQLSLSLRPLAETDEEKATMASAGKIDPKTGKKTEMAGLNDVPVMPPLSERSLTVDREISKLVGMAKLPNSGNSGAPSAAAPASSSAPPAPKPDLTIGRAEASVPVFLKQPGA